MGECRRLELRLDSVISSVDAAELCAKGLAREGGYGEEQVDRLGMAVREAAANAVTHGNAYSADKAVHFSVETSDNGLVVKVRDEGEGFDPSEVPDPTTAENLLKASGRGLLMMRALVDEVDVRNASPTGTEVVLILHSPAAEEDGQ
jgi:serine/threonine-protein kinase RsbW